MNKLYKLLILISLIFILRVFNIFLFVYDWMPPGFHDGWVFYYGRDFTFYFDMALSFSKFEVIGGIKPIGYPLFLTPFIWIFNAVKWQDIVVPVAVFQSLALGGLSFYLLGLIVYNITKSLRIAVCAVFFWCMIPIVAYFFFALCQSTDLLRGINIPSLIWIRMYPEPLLNTLFLLSIFFITKVGKSHNFVYFSAFFAGAAFLVREDGAVYIIILAMLTLYYCIKKELKLYNFITLSLVIGLTCSLQLIYNYLTEGNIFISGHMENAFDYSKELGMKVWSFDNIIFLFNYIFRNPLFSFILIFASLALALAFYLYKRNREILLFIYAIFVGFITFYSFYGPTRTDLFRFLMPTYICLSIIFSVLVFQIYDVLGRLRFSRTNRNTA